MCVAIGPYAPGIQNPGISRTRAPINSYVDALCFTKSKKKPEYGVWHALNVVDRVEQGGFVWLGT